MVTTSRYIEAPRRLRAFVRAHETSLVVLAALIGTIGGLVVAAMSAAVQGMHALLFNLDIGDRLSSQYRIDSWRALLEHDAFRFAHSLSFENSWRIRRV
jgi:CIC family chloride channel protein